MRLNLRSATLFLIALVLVFSPMTAAKADSGTDNVNTADNSCHFAITSLFNAKGYDVAALGAGSYLDWGSTPNSYLPANVQYVNVLRLRNGWYDDTLATLADRVNAQKGTGAVWIVGNEPDDRYIPEASLQQDSITPQDYAQRFYDVATQIRSLDPTAKIGFGTIVQPTPIRLAYLDRVIEKLSDLAGGQQQAFALIDLFSPHAFNLNEEPGSWGSGIPLGMDDLASLAQVITIDQTYDITLFKDKVKAYRDWMSKYGQTNKPMWITEFGVLPAPQDPPNGVDYANVSDEITRDYMLQAFDYVMTTKDNTVGYAADDYRLVQRMFWYSLNDYRYHFGGTLVDPLTKIQTIIGDAYMNYNPPAGSVPAVVDRDAYVSSAVVIDPIGHHGASATVDYRLTVRVGNNLSADTLTPVTVTLKEGGVKLTSKTANITHCAGQAVVTLNFTGTPGDTRSFDVEVAVASSAGTDVDTTNNVYSFDTTLNPPLGIYLPMTYRQ